VGEEPGDNPGRALVAKRRTVEAACALDGCDRTFTTRLRNGVPEGRYCSARHRAAAYYRENKNARLEYQRRRRAEKGGAAPTGESHAPTE
jgi:hypothetical protein